MPPIQKRIRKTPFTFCLSSIEFKFLVYAKKFIVIDIFLGVSASFHASYLLKVHTILNSLLTTLVNIGTILLRHEK